MHLWCDSVTLIMCSRKGEYLSIPQGWLCYLSAEVIRNLQAGAQYQEIELPFTEASDVYAFGCVYICIVQYNINLFWPYVDRVYVYDCVVWAVFVHSLENSGIG